VRILYFTRDYTPHDYRFLTTLAAHGQEVHYLRLERQGRQLEDRALPAEVRQIVWRGGRQPFQWRDAPALLMDLRRVLNEVRPDVLHAGPIQTAAFLSALSGFRPLVSMSWGSDLLKDADRSRLYRWITQYTLNRSTVLVGDCSAVRHKAASFGYPTDRTFIFPWGIDLQRFVPLGGENGPAESSLRARLGWQDCFVVLSLRAWEPVYGVDVLLRGFAQAAKEDPDLRLILLGGGSQAGLVHQIIQQNDLAGRVYLGGQVNQQDLPQIYQAADLYASASHSDGSSVSLMEALASGLPVLLSDIPSNHEWVTGGEHGWFFPDGDDRTLAELLLRARNQPETLTKMRAAAREQAERRADWTKNFQVLLQAYQQAVELNH